MPNRNIPPSDLPIEEALPDLRQALRRQPEAVLQAPTGAGKTTRVPLALLNEDWLGGDKIIMLEPRRLAARARGARPPAVVAIAQLAASPATVTG